MTVMTSGRPTASVTFNRNWTRVLSPADLEATGSKGGTLLVATVSAISAAQRASVGMGRSEQGCIGREEGEGGGGFGQTPLPPMVPPALVPKEPEKF